MNEFVKLFGAFVLYFVFIRGCNGECVSKEEDTKQELIKSGTSFFENCCSIYENATLRWLDSEQQEIAFGLGTDSNVYTERNGNEINLYIKQLSRGTYDYTCSAEIDGKTFNLKYIIEVYDPPFIYNASEFQNVIKGGDGMIYCSVGPINDSNIYTEWIREKYEETKISQNDKKYNINSETGLKINNVNDEDGGIYKCRASHYKIGDIVEQVIQVEVYTLPTINTLEVTPIDIIKEGDTLTIECRAQGQPHPEYTWKKISKNEENTTRWTQLSNTITITNVNRNDEGVYECTASNAGGSAKSTVSIEVQHAPNITSFKNITVLEGSVFAQLECKATGRPRPDVEIATDLEMDPSQPLIAHNFTESEATTTITFTNVSRFHDGLYYCNVNNSINNMTKVSKLNVFHKPYVIGSQKETVWGWNEKTLNLSCENESNPPANIMWTFKGNNSILDDPQSIAEVMKNISIYSNYATITINNEAYYGIYECTVVNSFGQDVKTIDLKRAFLPDPIEKATVIEIKPTSVTFNISGPSESKITGYTAQYDEFQNYDITNIHLNRTWSVDRPYRIDKLKPSTNYNVRFAAKNELGDGDWSSYIVFRTLESTAPEAPTWNHDSKESAALREISESTAITVKWNEPESNGDSIDYYMIRYCAVNDNTTETDEDEDRICEDQVLINNEITLENLIPNATYRIELLAHNSIGNSSVTSTSITTSALISDHPTSLLSAGAIIAVSVITVFICLLILDVILFLWQKKGIIASCFKKKKKKEDNFNSRDNKGLLKHSSETDDTIRRPVNRPKQPEYKNTGVITGKHSAV